MKFKNDFLKEKDQIVNQIKEKEKLIKQEKTKNQNQVSQREEFAKSF